MAGAPAPAPTKNDRGALVAAVVTLAVLFALALAALAALAAMVRAYLNSDQDYRIPEGADPERRLPAYFINLDSSPGRREAMGEQFRALHSDQNARRVVACDGSDPRALAEGLAAFGVHGVEEWAQGTQACLVSHLQAIRRFLDEPGSPPFGIVLEDDVVLPRALPLTVRDFYATLGTPPVREHDQPFLLMLHPGYKGTRLRSRVSHHMNYLHPFRALGYTNGYGAQGYLVNRAAARLVLRYVRERPSVPVDELFVDRVTGAGLFVYVARQPFLRHREDAKSDREQVDREAPKLKGPARPAGPARTGGGS